MTIDDIPLITEEDLMTLDVELQTNISIDISEILPLTSSAEAGMGVIYFHNNNTSY